MTNTNQGKKAGRGESAIQAFIMLGVAGMAGAASFTHVHDWTMHNSPAGTGDWFGWANAMVSELIPLAAGLELRRRVRLYGSAGIYPVALIIGAVALSLTGQFAEAKPSFSGWLISAVPALGFLALVKLVLSSPHKQPATTSDPQPPVVDMDHTDSNVRPSTAIVPAVVIDPVPQHLLASARFAATNYQQTTGQPITADELAARISIPTATAAGLLSALDSDTPAANGHNLTTVAGGVR